MTTTTTPVFVPTGHDLSFAGTLRSEWIKLRSLRSTWWCFGIIVVLTVGFGALLSSALSLGEGVPAEAHQGLAAQAVTVGVAFASLVVSVLGVLVISGEYSTGMIRSTLTAVPGRISALVAKAIVFAGVTALVAVVAFGLTVPISAALLSGRGVDVDFSDGDYWLTILGAAAYLVLIGLLAFSIGAIIRSTAGGIAVALGLVLAVPIVISIIGSFTDMTWLLNVNALLPSEAGGRLFTYPSSTPVTTPEGVWALEPWQGGLVLVGWVVVLFAAAALLLKRRDA